MRACRLVASAAILLVCLAQPVFAQETPLRDATVTMPVATVQALVQGPSKQDRVDVALGITSLSASSVAMSLTAACLAAETCEEVNPLMRKWLGHSQTSAIVGKAAIAGATHYAVYRFIRKGKLRTVLLGVLAGVNVFDAAHDVRVMRQIEERRGR